MKSVFRTFIPALPLCAMALSCHGAQGREEITITVNERAHPIATSMYGVFFEEINHAGDGGLYAELVKNRSFEEKEMPSGYRADGDKLIPRQVCYHLDGKVRDRSYKWTTEDVPGWSLSVDKASEVTMKVVKDNPRFATAPCNLELSLKKVATPVELVNKGYWGMNFAEAERYQLRTILKAAPGYKGHVYAVLLTEDGETLTEERISLPANGEWHDVSMIMKPSGSDARGRLALKFDAPGKVWIDYVSLFPENTFNNRPNGLRRDVAQMIADLRPAFFRWPGGCVVEGITLDNRFEWKKTLGDPAARPGEYSTWGYRCSYGFGYHEMLQFCEDIGAKAMFVCNVGLGCQFRMGDACVKDSLEYYLNDCLDAIEYALGATDTKWGAKRAAAGHLDPFPLQYVEIGNENWGPEYDSRFDVFYREIKSRYPQLTLIYNEMPQREGPSRIAKTDMIDPHWYVDPYFFFRNANMFDNYERGKHDIYVGEYACNRGVGGGNMLAALSEAAFIGGMERNSDLVKMASYAPLFENRHDRSWDTNLIWIDTDKVMGRSSYYVQKMASENRPTYNLPSNIHAHNVAPEYFEKGYIGLGAEKANVEFADIKITKERAVTRPSLSIQDSCGRWNVDKASGIMASSRGKYLLLSDKQDGKYTFQCKMRKTSGEQGAQFFIGTNSSCMTGFKYNIGMWSSNDRAELTRMDNGKERGILAEYQGRSIETGKWYDVKITVCRDSSSLYLDGKKILSYQVAPTPLQHLVCGYDEPAGEMVVKVVNASPEPYRTSIRLDGAERIASTGTIITMAAKDGGEENSFENPTKIAPVVSKVNGFSQSFRHDFKPFSYTILRIKALRKL